MTDKRLQCDCVVCGGTDKDARCVNQLSIRAPHRSTIRPSRNEVVGQTKLEIPDDLSIPDFMTRES
jgi:hypothetical protein